ncbi:Transaldolase [Geitlerinema sp. FC II]|nr:Transaldolase [Geitlerinema sp. FC II]
MKTGNREQGTVNSFSPSPLLPLSLAPPLPLSPSPLLPLSLAPPLP